MSRFNADAMYNHEEPTEEELNAPHILFNPYKVCNIHNKRAIYNHNHTHHI